MTTRPVPTPLKGDFHMHTWYSRDCGTPPVKLLRRALKVGLSVIAVTEHNTIKGALEVQRLAREQNAPIKVIVAEEIKTPYGEITGLFLNEEVPKGLSPKETVERIKAQGGLVSIPHPFDRFRRSPLTHGALMSVLPQADIIEVFNARTTLLRDSQRARDLAKQYGIASSAGSDAHHPWELGHVFVEMPDFTTPAEFKQALLHAAIYGRRSTPLFHLVSRYYKWQRKLFGHTHV
ncbi:MAG: PHP domain-containing protein [Chloroflexi bacterium]|nr:PHP domain-containing protein [Chloroflexota bacterium]